MATVEEAIADAQQIADAGGIVDAALRRIALAAYESMPCSCGGGVWKQGDRCGRCQKVQEYSA